MPYVVVRTTRTTGRRAWLGYRPSKLLGVGSRRLGWGPKDLAETFETVEDAKHALPWVLHGAGIITVEEVEE